VIALDLRGFAALAIPIGFLCYDHSDVRWTGYYSLLAGVAAISRGAARDTRDLWTIVGFQAVNIIAFDPVNSDRLIVVVPQHPTAAARVRAVERNATGAWIATNLADTLPSLASSRLPPTVATEALAGFTNVFYVGTQRGAWQGAVDTGGVTTWRQSLDSPDTWIADIQRADTTLRLASYGRGIWERRHFPRPCDSGACAQRPTATAHCLACWREAGSQASRPTTRPSCVKSRSSPRPTMTNAWHASELHTVKRALTLRNGVPVVVSVHVATSGVSRPSCSTWIRPKSRG
jgi:hypothetical protein